MTVARAAQALFGEVVRRVTVQTYGAYLRESLTGPPGIDIFVGLPQALEARCADVVPRPASPEDEALRRQLGVDPTTLNGPELMRFNAYRNPPEISGTGVVNTRAWRAAEVRATNGRRPARPGARL